MTRTVLLLIAAMGIASPAVAARGEQLGRLGGLVRRAEQLREWQITADEERQIGAAVSERVRQRYGVVQDPAIHRYVALVGSAVAQSLDTEVSWTFVVLDTDAVNAFAAPGGFVHITRGALALIDDEAELAGVLGHEIVHVTEKHTIRALQKDKSIQTAAARGLSGNAALLNRLVENVYLEIVEKGFGRTEELESDEKGLVAANATGYAPQGLARFLTRLQERNAESEEKRGLFASHPEMQERLERLAALTAAKRLTATVALADRYAKHISYEPVPLAEIAVIETGAAGLAGEGKDAEKKDQAAQEPPKKRGFGLGGLLPIGGEERKTAEVAASGGTRGVDPERDAEGGANPALVPVSLSAEDVAAFKQEGGLG